MHTTYAAAEVGKDSHLWKVSTVLRPPMTCHVLIIFFLVWLQVRRNIRNAMMRQLPTPSIGTGGVVGPHYASSKSALHGLVHWIAQRYAKEGIVSPVSYLHPTGSFRLVS
jgi:NAD(P)-dependent dehydrogenase (short-subunit alcohol dehydrogenase family)